MLLAFFILSAGVVAYVYAGYPLLLWAVVRVRGARAIRRRDITPSMTLIISAYNEADVIRRKIENCLSLQYPRGLLDIVVVSDASNDGTDAIVAEYAGRGVRLERQPERRGKTAGLNRTVHTVRGDIVVFSDANAMYREDALLMLARNFADPDVGCVTGEARYVAGDSSTADVGERAYWDYEIQIKRLETALGSMVGGDGAIYAIRRELWQPLPENAINDFLNPLQIVAAGWRAVYEPEAVCFEETAGDIRAEYRRRVRIVSRSWRAVFQAPGVLNPWRVGLFTWCLVSHKMLRWLLGVFGVAAAVAAITLGVQLLDLLSVVIVGAVVGAATLVTSAGRRFAAMLAYVGIIHAASVVGVFKGVLGRVSGVWSTPRQSTHPAPAPRRMFASIGTLLQLALAAIVVAAFVVHRSFTTDEFAFTVFWVAGALLAYVYVGYPVLLAVIRVFAFRPVFRGALEPTVCVFIAANNEASVIEAKLHNTLTLDYPPDRLQVIVASDGSDDGTNDIVRRFAPRVELLDLHPRHGKMAAINAGMAAVRSEIVVFSDANTFLEADAIRALVRNFADPEVGGVSGDVVLVGDRASLGRSEDLYYRYERWVQRAESEIGSMVGADGALYAIRRELVVAPPADTILDDMAIPMGVIQAGRRLVFEGAARAIEQGSETAKEEFARKARVIAGAMQFMRRRESAVPVSAPQVVFSLISHKALRWLSPVFTACTFVSSIIVADAGPIYAAAAIGQAAVLATAAAGCIPAVRRWNIVALAHYFCLLQAAAAVGFVRGLAGRQSVLWERFARGQAPMHGVQL